MSQVPHQDDHQVQNVPDAAEVAEPVHVDFQDFLHHIVEDEDAEDDLTAHDEEVPVTDVSDQLNCADLPGRDGPSCGWELYHQPVRKVSWRGGRWDETVSPASLVPHSQPKAPGGERSPHMDGETEWGKGTHLRIQKRLMLAL